MKCDRLGDRVAVFPEQDLVCATCICLNLPVIVRNGLEQDCMPRILDDHRTRLTDP